MPYADVNGLHMYYETEGSGRPLVLIHGGLMSASMFGPMRTELAKARKVIAVDLQGHGRTADVDRPLHPKAMAGDIVALIEQQNKTAAPPALSNESFDHWVDSVASVFLNPIPVRWDAKSRNDSSVDAEQSSPQF